MIKAPLYSQQGKKTKEVDLNPAIFGVRVNQRLLQLAGAAYAGNVRRGTASTKTRKEVRGGGKKPWRQKGTGRARAGSIRAPHWRGGGTIFGPHPRSYETAMPKSMRRQALINALSFRTGQKNILLLDKTELKSAKTKEWVGVLNALPLEEKRGLCIVKEVGENLKRASRNLRYRVEIRTAEDVNAYQVLQREKVMIEEGALEAIEKRLLGSRMAGNGKPVKKTSAKKPAARKKTVKKKTGDKS